MSDKVRALVWDYYDPHRFGAPIILAIALSDEADDRGGGIFQSNEGIARKTRQTVRAVQQQLRRLERAKLLQCVRASAGGSGKFNEYRLELALLLAENHERGSGLTMNVVHGSDAGTMNVVQGFFDPSICKDLKPLVLEPGTTIRVRAEADDERLARWILEKIRALNPKHREPSWRTWLKDLRLLRERDGRSHREIAELFAWANADAFWQANILSPGKLREKWDQLQLKRRGNSGGIEASAPPEDRRCAGTSSGLLQVRCPNQGTFATPDSKWWCAGCRDARDRGAEAAA